MKIPTNLKHKPVFVVEDYDQIDGRYAGNTDAKGLSIGIAQWGPDASAKVWRHTDEKWSRQSEELPIHRVLDLALLICATKANIENIDITGLPVNFNVKLASGDAKIEQQREFVSKEFNDESNGIDDRLKQLSNMLKQLGY